MLKNFLFLFTAIFLFTSCGQTKKATNPKGTEVTVNEPKSDIVSEAKSLPKSLLWRINGNGLTVDSYLFGTIHLIDKDKYFTPSGTLEAIDKAETMIFEIDLKDMQDMSKMFAIMTQAYMNDDIGLKDLVSEEDYIMVKEHFEAMGIPFQFMEKIKPMFLSMMGGDVDMTSLQSGEMVSYEMKFFELAESMNMETGGLESIEYQMSLFDSIPYAVQAEMLVEAVKSGGGTTDDSLDELIGKYLEQDIDALSNIITQESDDMEGFAELLVNRRNENWIPQIAELSATKSAFYAVGAGHLGGKHGVIRLLREAGFTVEPYKAN